MLNYIYTASPIDIPALRNGWERHAGTPFPLAFEPCLEGLDSEIWEEIISLANGTFNNSGHNLGVCENLRRVVNVAESQDPLILIRTKELIRGKQGCLGEVVAIINALTEIPSDETTAALDRIQERSALNLNQLFRQICNERDACLWRLSEASRLKKIDRSPLILWMERQLGVTHKTPLEEKEKRLRTWASTTKKHWFLIG